MFKILGQNRENWRQLSLLDSNILPSTEPESSGRLPSMLGQAAAHFESSSHSGRSRTLLSRSLEAKRLSTNITDVDGCEHPSTGVAVASVTAFSESRDRNEIDLVSDSPLPTSL